MVEGKKQPITISPVFNQDNILGNILFCNHFQGIKLQEEKNQYVAVHASHKQWTKDTIKSNNLSQWNQYYDNLENV